jgi:polysaccharide biosynthesis protein PelA
MTETQKPASGTLCERFQHRAMSASDASVNGCPPEGRTAAKLEAAAAAISPAAVSRRHGGQTTPRRTFLKICGTLIGACAAGGEPSYAAKSSVRWMAYYGETADEQMLSSYDIVMLDPGFKGSIGQVAKAGARVCAYLSLGEIRSTDPFFAQVDRAALMDENPDWSGTFRLDVRHQSWQNLVLRRVMPDIIAKGFTGLLLDTLDMPPYLEQIDLDRNHGMRQAAVDLVRSIRESYPHMLVLMNRGYALLPEVAASIDGVVAESLLTTYNSGRDGGYRWNAASEVALQLSLLAPAKHHRLLTLSLDYWDPEDPGTIGKIYALERKLGNHPYIATRLLDRVIPEPA